MGIGKRHGEEGHGEEGHGEEGYGEEGHGDDQGDIERKGYW